MSILFRMQNASNVKTCLAANDEIQIRIETIPFILCMFVTNMEKLRDEITMNYECEELAKASKLS